jgi:cytochrome c-type biogenesis protein CcmH
MRPEITRSAVCVLVALWLTGGVVAAGALEDRREIEHGLMCYCGCSDLTVRVCTCGTAEAIRTEIADRLARGESEQEILAVFIDRHGEQILSAPTREGFNLLAWIVPFAALFIAAGALVVVVRRWAARGEQVTGSGDGAGVTTTIHPADPDYRKLLEKVEREIKQRL